MRLRAATIVFFSAITAFGIVPFSASPARAQSAPTRPLAAKPQPALPLRHRMLASAANSPNLSRGADVPLLASRNGLSSRQRAEWLLLSAAQHGAAFFDARTTREAVSHNHRELDPLLRPFAHSAALYPVMQIAPTGLDWLAIRLATSRHRWLRRIWWVPQAAAAAGFIWSGAHNLVLPPSP